MAKLRIYTDENVDIRVAQGLRNWGIDAFAAQEKGMTGSTDFEHFNYAYQMQAVIFTHDRHFLEIAKKLVEAGKSHWGVIFVSMSRLSVGKCIKKLALYADILTPEDMKNQIEFL